MNTTITLNPQSTSLSPSTEPNDTRQGPDANFFSNAQDITINGGQFTLTQTNSYASEAITSRTAVFVLLKPYTCLNATKDSSARHPPPRCHPGTRERIRNRLMQWLVNENDQWKMVWVRGFAGTGKSAVAQSFADSCDDEGILGGTYFFFRAGGINKPETVVPTLIYQLATNVPEYQSLIERRLAKNPSLLENSPPVQFRKLIVEPFAVLQRERPRNPIAVILDGLDECEGENAQKEILDMIANAIRTNPDLPIRWLIFSRPEAHLKNAFFRNSECGRDELIIDAECRENVEQYIKDQLLDIKATYDDVTPEDWPSQEELQEVLTAVDGLFVLASTCVNYIGDCEEADPVSQLDNLLRFMRRLQGVVSRSPLATLDLLYLRILEDIPPSVYETTSRILGCLSLQSRTDKYHWLQSAQALANFLRLDQRTFYKAVRGLHSVLWIPDLKDAINFQLQFHHASFHEFLLDPLRSGRFTINEQQMLVDNVTSAIYWHEIDATHFHKNDGWDSDWLHEHDCLPGLPWASNDNRVQLSQSIVYFTQGCIFSGSFPLQLDKDLSTQLLDIDFRYWRAQNVFDLARICKLDPSTSVIRGKPSSATDYQLLEYFNIIINNGIARPATFPLTPYQLYSGWVRDYFFIGHGIKSVIVWKTCSPVSDMIFNCSLRSDKEPSEVQISEYREFLRIINWDEEEAELEMK